MKIIQAKERMMKMANLLNAHVVAGIHQSARNQVDCFIKSEKEIVNQWSAEWYITRVGNISVLGSEYQYIFAKPTESYEEALGISRELVVVFSTYSNFEARSLEAYDAICEGIQDARIERTCYVMISKCPHIKEQINSFLSNQECQVVIPFSFEEFKQNKSDSYFIRNRFRESFKSRDLFDYSDPLKKDFYFFGRNEIVVDIIDKHHENLNTGLFGLRKTGKTSIIYDVIRKIDKDDALGVLVDCQNTSFNMRRWNRALYFVVSQVCKKTNIAEPEEDKFTEENAGRLFVEQLTKIHRTTQKSILLLFDEIENITFGKSAVEHWRDGFDFVYFWQSIRSAYQNSPSGVFTFCILGTNAKCVEEPLIRGADNPIFNIFQPKYIPGFSVQQTREMVRKLGRLMGIKFDETIYSKLTEDYGGHPFLVRRVCSMIAQNYPNRPVTIDRIKYQAIRDKFNRESDYFKMLLEVLKQFYDIEYEMLETLAVGNTDDFKMFAQEDYGFVKHLIGYGLIQEVDGEYDFQIDAIKQYLQRTTNKSLLNMSTADKWKELCSTRGELEQRLRTMVRKILKIAFRNEAGAKEEVLRKASLTKPKYKTMSYADLFDSRKSEIYLKNLKDLINANWEYFADYFKNQEYFISAMDVINCEGRFDAHATVPTGEEMEIIRGSINYILKGINKYEEE